MNGKVGSGDDVTDCMPADVETVGIAAIPVRVILNRRGMLLWQAKTNVFFYHLRIIQ
ncbi:hypothetical protein HUG20_11395 [Salicibibacter cibi]|uniref:Uncharacterized protein n=1 Tax=Salicibibacter cibi TaxID=2743001 RepID=A0A7T6ZBP2_9BACI|nr:hypothetical protein [Salicibibacter cibi]QQK80437.1 hypothetical protein HUG20_11395 [Salicibibacter cibi]